MYERQNFGRFDHYKMEIGKVRCAVFAEGQDKCSANTADRIEFPVGQRQRGVHLVAAAADLQPLVLGALAGLGWVDPASIACLVCQVIPCAYVHFTPERERCIQNILGRLVQFNVYPIGRYGLWD